MSALQEDILKATSLKWDQDNATFVRLQGSSRATKDRKMNERNVKKPQNLGLLEDDNDEFSNSFLYDKTKPGFDKHAISAAIKEVNGGLDLSNRHLEQCWFACCENNAKKEKSTNSPPLNDVKAHSKNQSENLRNKQINKQAYMHKLRKNAAIMGIVNSKKTSLEELIRSSKENFTKGKNKLEAFSEVSTSDLMDGDDDDDDDIEDIDTNNYYDYNGYGVESVPHHEVEGVFIHPLQKGIDVTKCKNIDFTLPRKGKEKKITPKAHFLQTAIDCSFGFKKRNA